MSGITERTKVIQGEGPFRSPAALIEDGALFAWACRTGEVRDGELASVCEISGTDRGEYVAHMHEHGRKAPATPGAPAMWKPPPRREYNPKPMDPGQVIVWTVRIPARWTVPPRYDSETGACTEGIGWVETVEYERIGTVWSEATSPSCWWVVPDDDESNPVVVRRAGKSARLEWPEGALYESGECSGWREGIRRAENVRWRGVYAVIDGESRDAGRWIALRKKLTWHADPDCPGADGYDRWDGKEYVNESGWDVWRIADVLVGRVHLASPGPFCPRCVMLEPEPEPARELVTA